MNLACLINKEQNQTQLGRGSLTTHGMLFLTSTGGFQAANGDYFSQYVTEDFTNYVNRKRQDFTHGNHIEMQAMSEMYNRTIEVFCYGKGRRFVPQICNVSFNLSFVPSEEATWLNVVRYLDH